MPLRRRPRRCCPAALLGPLLLATLPPERRAAGSPSAPPRGDADSCAARVAGAEAPRGAARAACDENPDEFLAMMEDQFYLLQTQMKFPKLASIRPVPEAVAALAPAAVADELPKELPEHSLLQNGLELQPAAASRGNSSAAPVAGAAAAPARAATAAGPALGPGALGARSGPAAATDARPAAPLPLPAPPPSRPIASVPGTAAASPTALGTLPLPPDGASGKVAAEAEELPGNAGGLLRISAMIRWGGGNESVPLLQGLRAALAATLPPEPSATQLAGQHDTAQQPMHGYMLDAATYVLFMLPASMLLVTLLIFFCMHKQKTEDQKRAQAIMPDTFQQLSFPSHWDTPRRPGSGWGISVEVFNAAGWGQPLGPDLKIHAHRDAN